MVLRPLWLLVLKWPNYLNCLRSATKVWERECICETEGKVPSLYSLFRREQFVCIPVNSKPLPRKSKPKEVRRWNYMACATLGWVVVNLTPLCRKLLCRIMSPFDSNLIILKFQAGPLWGWGTSHHSVWHIFFCLAESPLDSCCPTQCQKMSGSPRKVAARMPFIRAGYTAPARTIYRRERERR